MTSFSLTLLFVSALVASLLVKFWLATRQMRHVAAHRGAVPSQFADSISLETHQKAADYTLTKVRFGLLTDAFSAAVLVGWTLLGGLDVLNSLLLQQVAPRLGFLAYQLCLVIGFSMIGMLIELPFDLYLTFVIEERFQFNRTTWPLFWKDLGKMVVVSLVLMVPLLAFILWLMGAAGTYWWVLAWAGFVAYLSFVRVIYPIWIAPWFNKFEPLQDEALETRARALMARCGFAVKAFFVMDGSLRSAHANAYFTGSGPSRRVVFYDTLLSKLNGAEMEAVLAHELGHFKLHHLAKGIAMMFAISLAGFALLGWVSTQTWFFTGLGVNPSLAAPNDALALLLLMAVVPVFGYFLAPFFSQFSRKHEFEADAYACSQADARDLASALRKLNEDNASTLTPDPVYVRFYYSHPPASERLAALPLTPSHQAG
jgi:STE24 endopeptidase